MNKPTHSPGPWEIQECGAEEYWSGCGAYDVGPAVVGKGQGVDPVAEADARLIAAAPELLEFCQTLRQFGTFYRSAIELEMYNPIAPDGDQLSAMLDDVISKATGTP